MLETRNLCKVYKPKKGVPVKALDNVSLKFPEKGMVFLLGKSGSGKSTLLNLLGGLDKYDGGEIIIKGVSSKDFKQSYFDSYRNTYVGFIFQEYNILEEFSVGANIALAIELQGRKATDVEINAILKEVDLEGYGNRKPNELSGGQKQRVAIARALIKNPNIIMADEPTGALDSNTGKQVFDTLKKLSKDKLVIIVSHDREFSERYADRIIELADGHVISDVEIVKDGEEVVIEETEGINFNGSVVEISRGYHLTEEDRLAINDYIDKIASGEVSLQVKTKKGSAGRFVNTNQEKINAKGDGNFKLIKSKLPFKNAFKIGASGLKYKKIKLVFTIILSVIAFSLFGFADTFGSYNHIKTCVKSLEDSNVNYVSLAKAKKVGEGEFSRWYNNGNRISEDDLKFIEEKTGLELTGIYYPEYSNIDLYFMSHFNQEADFGEGDNIIYAETFNGFAEITEEGLNKMGYELVAGRIPDGNKNEIAISEYVYKTFELAGYTEARDVNADEKVVYKTINEYEDMIGKELDFGGAKYTITGIVDTHVDLERYSVLNESYENLSAADTILRIALEGEFNDLAYSSLATSAMVGEGHVAKLVENALPITRPGYPYSYLEGTGVGNAISGVANVNDIDFNSVDITWVDGEKTTLGEKEIIVTSDYLNTYGYYEYYDIEMDTVVSDKEMTGDYADLKDKDFTLNLWDGAAIDDYYYNYKIVGVIDVNVEENMNWYGTIIFSEKDYELVMNGEEIGIYELAVGAMPESRSGKKDIVEFANTDFDGEMFKLQNAVIYELEIANEILPFVSKIFFGIGIGFAIFASLLLSNFIANSISYKKQEIGILRAIGSRSNDVFAIFFSESLIIAIINFVLSSTGVAVIVAIINYLIRTNVGILVTILNFGFRQVLLLLVISVGIAAIASFIPVMKIASKKPIDAIRNR